MSIMRHTESLILAVVSLRANLMRSILTTLGIIVGVASVIAVISIMQGFAHSITQQFENMGSNTVIVRPYVSFKDQLSGKTAQLTVNDLDAIGRYIEGIDIIIPAIDQRGVRLSYKGQNTTLQFVRGTVTGYDDMNNHYPENGRFMIPSDDAFSRKVIVLGADNRKDLDLPETPAGEYVQVNSQWYKVVGEMEKTDAFLGFSQDNVAFIPFQNAVAIMREQAQRNMFFMIKATNLDDSTVLIAQIERLLRKRHKIRKGDKDDFQIDTSEQLKEQFEGILDTMTLVVAAIVGVSLLVGGIGIMNIMLVSVTERTREIGICKALGATRSDILIQFLAEAVALCLLGGLVGIAIGFGLGKMVGALVPSLPEIVVPLWAILLSLGFSSAVGVLFGIVPASKAANLDPIQALHYE
ncbi:MAG: multidrug ABC transporter substrate-binding protein [Kordiimonadales bacterium]|nr:MAG: multidrug ABC transporter substrate-binding protein [Kordiimonadales bacterium]